MVSSAYVLGKLYSNTLLVVFNNRIFLARARQLSGNDTGVFEIQTASAPRIKQTAPEAPSKITIDISREIAVDLNGDFELEERVRIHGSEDLLDTY